ncbi:MAG: hypothetical protein IJ678_04180, partial [Kiritimatiellae bacterium]|nr:hypothetical protein [Kiritimatiellia bacterium]
QTPAPADAPVAVDPRAATNADPGFPWGVIVTNSFCYDPALKRLGRLPGGTVVAWTGKRATPIGEVADVYVMRNREWQPNPRALLVSDLILFEGATYAETDPSQRDPVIDWCAAYGKLEQLRADAAKASSGPVAGNPYQQEYDAAKTKFDSVQNEVNAVMSKIRWSDTHELPGGLRERGELMRRAQALRPLQNDARRAFLEIEGKYNSWAETEGRKRESSSAASDRALRMKMLEEEMERLRPAVQSVVPGI